MKKIRLLEVFVQGHEGRYEATVFVAFHNDGKQQIKMESGNGIGPIDAVCSAIDVATKTRSKLRKFSINPISEGSDADGVASLSLTFDENDKLYNATGQSRDIIKAAALAHVSALNQHFSNSGG